jgi:hypothetical protein
MNSRVGLKRMSSQLIVFSKQDMDDSSESMAESREQKRTYTKMFTKTNICNRGARSNNSIVKLLNIYKNRKEDELAQSLKN